MFGLALPEILTLLVVATLSSALIAVPAAFLCRRIGFSPWLGLAAIVPVANLALLWYVAFAAWPAERGSQASQRFSPV